MSDMEKQAGEASKAAVCELCGELMPQGEDMFKYHGYSGPCPKSAAVPAVPAQVGYVWVGEGPEPICGCGQPITKCTRLHDDHFPPKYVGPAVPTEKSPDEIHDERFPDTPIAVPVQPAPQGGDYRPHYRKHETDVYIESLRAEIAQLRAALAAKAAPQVEAEVSPSGLVTERINAAEAALRLREIHKEVQCKINDQWDWMDADFYVEMLLSMAQREEAAKAAPGGDEREGLLQAALICGDIATSPLRKPEQRRIALLCKERIEIHAALSTPAPTKTCPNCEGKGTEADYVGLEMRPVEVDCSQCKGLRTVASTPAPTAQRYLLKDMADALVEADKHVAELESAWQRGCITEHDGMGGTRSNRNHDVGILIDKVLARYAASQPGNRDGVALIAAERARQISVEGWTPEHDDTHTGSELAKAAEAYLVMAWAQIRKLDWGWLCYEGGRRWPRGMNAMSKPKHDPVGLLTKAGALIAAEIDRLQRLASQPEGGDGGDIDQEANSTQGE